MQGYTAAQKEDLLVGLATLAIYDGGVELSVSLYVTVTQPHTLRRSLSPGPQAASADGRFGCFQLEVSVAVTVSVLTVQAENIHALIRASGNSVQTFWGDLFAQALAGQDLDNIIVKPGVCEWASVAAFASSCTLVLHSA